nr:DUF4062 domain-containing protein [uncultured Rhodopila sp.]
MATSRHSVMISSTYKELADHRVAVSKAALGQGMYPLDMANDSAIPDQDLIAASLAKVDEADAYVGLISYRYGQIIEDPGRNPDGFSLTELEFRRAAKNGLPICMFIMHADHPVPRSAVNAEPATAGKLAAFIELAKKDRIYAEFTSVDDLKAKVVQTLALLKDVLDKAASPKPAPITPAAAATPDIPAPPAFYARPPYLPGYAFQGRVKELAALKDWAGSADAMLVFEAIGGMGKSMVTWEWVTKHAAADRADWAGILWYSFYERGAEMKDFCVTALSYMTRRPRNDLRTRPSFELADELLSLLRERPWLLVLDGLERTLVAYNRSDAAQIRDDEVEASEGATGAAPTNCFRPDDDDLLRQLSATGRSKILISSRLMPRVLLNALGQPRPGVRRFQLLGLDPRDAESMLRQAGITGDGERMQQYLERQFGCHPLVIGVAGGLVLNHMRARGNFDRWVDDPDGGASVNLADADIVQRRTHILKLAFEGLEPNARELMARIAVIANAVDLDVLEALNPARPLPPKEVKAPVAPDFENGWYLEMLRERHTEAKTDEERADLAQQIADHQREQQDEYKAACQAYTAYQSALSVWRGSDSLRAATRWLNAALRDLETRGLLQCDRQTGKYDLHPVVRGYTVGSLTAEGRAQAGQQVADYFSSRPAPSYETAISLEDLVNRIQVVQALNLAAKATAAWDALRGDLDRALYRLERHHELLALLRPLFPGGWSAPPVGVDDPGFVAGEAALALKEIGLLADAAVQEIFGIEDDIETGDTRNLSVRLRNHSATISSTGETARAERLLRLALDAAVATADDEQALWCELFLVSDLVVRGALADARTAWTELATRLPDAARRDGQLEAQALLIEAQLAFREGALTAAALGVAVDRVHALAEPAIERRLRSLSGDWHQANFRNEAAVEAYGRAIEMAHAVGLRDTESEAARGLSLARLGHRAEAEAAAASAERDPPHAALAELYLELGDRNKARHHAIEGYKLAWADGPPYAFRWSLQTCRKVLQALNEPEPQLPPYDPARIKPIEFEADIRRLLAEHEAKKKPPPED